MATIKNRTIEYGKEKDQDAVYLDEKKANEQKDKIKSAYTNAASDYQKIAQAFKAIHNDKNSKGILKDNFNKLWKSSEQRERVASGRINNLNKALAKDIQAYAIQMLQNRIASLETQIRNLMSQSGK